MTALATARVMTRLRLGAIARSFTAERAVATVLAVVLGIGVVAADAMLALSAPVTPAALGLLGALVTGTWTIGWLAVPLLAGRSGGDARQLLQLSQASRGRFALARIVENLEGIGAAVTLAGLLTPVLLAARISAGAAVTVLVTAPLRLLTAVALSLVLAQAIAGAPRGRIGWLVSAFAVGTLVGLLNRLVRHRTGARRLAATLGVGRGLERRRASAGLGRCRGAGGCRG